MSLTHEDIDWSVLPKPAKKQNAPKAPPVEDKTRLVTGVESDEPEEKEKAEPEVRFVSAKWRPGPQGYKYNEKCFLDVKAEYLKKTIRAKIRGKLWGIYNGTEEDLRQEVTGELEKDGSGTITVGRLWFLEGHYEAWQKDPQTPCSYIIKNISHSRGSNTIDSPLLELPPRDIVTVRLNINPAQIRGEDVRFVLFTSDDSGKAVNQTKTLLDDKILGDEFIDIDFCGLLPQHNYSLKILLPDQQEKLIFENTPFEDLIDEQL